LDKQIFPRVAVGGVIFKDENVLLVKRSNPPAKDMWAIPGGKILPGETMHEALQREIREETGLEIKPMEVVYVFDVIEYSDQKQISFHYVIIDFLCVLSGGSLKAGDDAQSVKWFSKSDLNKYPVNKKTLNLLKNKLSNWS